jgi:hypothetical protein
MWFRWISGTYLVIPPGYDGPLPEGGCYVRRSRTNHVLLVGRAFRRWCPASGLGD